MTYDLNLYNLGNISGHSGGVIVSAASSVHLPDPPTIPSPPDMLMESRIAMPHGFDVPFSEYFNFPPFVAETTCQAVGEAIILPAETDEPATCSAHPTNFLEVEKTAKDQTEHKDAGTTNQQYPKQHRFLKVLSRTGVKKAAANTRKATARFTKHQAERISNKASGVLLNLFWAT